MSARAARRHEDLALIAKWSHAVYDGRALRGHVHPVDRGWLAEGADGETLGVFLDERDAVRAVLAAGRRAA
jgi:hypothetical protein